MGNPSVYLSATDKLTFAKEMDELYAKQSLLRSSPTPTREIVDALLLQVPNATPEEKAAINTTMFLPEQLVTINEEQIIQTAGMIVSTDAIKKVDAMLVRQLQIGEYDG